MARWSNNLVKYVVRNEEQLLTSSYKTNQTNYHLARSCSLETWRDIRIITAVLAEWLTVLEAQKGDLNHR